MSDIASLRIALQELGLSTSTSGLRGEERRQALLARLNANSSTSNEKCPAINVTSFDVKALTTTELRKMLEGMGVATSTPGMVGEERRAVLQDRLRKASSSNQPKSEHLKHRKRSMSLSNIHTGVKTVDEEAAVAEQSPSKVSNMINNIKNYTTGMFSSGPNMLLTQEAEALKDDIERIRLERRNATVHELGNIPEELKDLDSKLQNVKEKRQRLVNAKATSVDSSPATFFTSIVDGNLQEFNQTDILPVLQVMENNVQRKIVVNKRKQEEVSKTHRANPTYGILEELRKIDRIRVIERELNVKILPVQNAPQQAATAPATSKPMLRRRMSLPTPASNGSLDAVQDITTADRLGQHAFFCQTIQRNHDAAEQLYKLAIKENPNQPVILGNYALFLREIRMQYDDAELYFRKAISADENNVTNMSNFANFLQQIKKEYVEAEKYYAQCIEKDPCHVGSLVCYADFLHRVSRKFTQSEQYYLQALHLEARNPNTLSHYASLLFDMGKWEKSEEYHMQATQVEGSTSHHLGNFANFLKRRNRLSEAKSMYLHALQKDPSNEIVSKNYAILLRDFPTLRNGVLKRISVHPDERRKFLRRKSENALETLPEIGTSDYNLK